MSKFLTCLSEPSEDHRIEPATEGFVIVPQTGREEQFDALARRVINHHGPFAAFARRGSDGRYDCVHIIPEGDR
jgi:hypothetical protein